MRSAYGRCRPSASHSPRQICPRKQWCTVLSCLPGSTLSLHPLGNILSEANPPRRALDRIHPFAGKTCRRGLVEGSDAVAVPASTGLSTDHDGVSDCMTAWTRCAISWHVWSSASERASISLTVPPRRAGTTTESRVGCPDAGTATAGRRDIVTQGRCLRDEVRYRYSVLNTHYPCSRDSDITRPGARWQYS